MRIAWVVALSGYRIFMPRPCFRLLALSMAGLLPSAFAGAATGSSNVAAIEPPAIAHPSTTPCTVTLLAGAAFGARSAGFAYAPPAACPGPWSKVVLSVDVAVQAGRQFDRTGTLWLGGVNLWFGTTAEPRRSLAPSWHVERDVTDDTALFRTASTGHMLIANYQGTVYTSTITGSASLAFYPADAANPAPRTPDVVIPFASSPDGDTVFLNGGADTLSRTLALPSNIERASFDAILQGQANDEFWYTCVPDALVDTLETCGGTAFREGALRIDGTPAGVAPVFPVIFTGGIDPYLWEPVPGPTTLDLRPFRMELTPFAGVLDRPGPHTISLGVANASGGFSVTGTLYLYLDHGAASDTGALTADTLGAATPAITDTETQDGDTLHATVATTSAHDFTLSGTLQTSHGPVATTLAQDTRFRNTQTFAISPSIYVQDIDEDTETTERLTTRDGRGTVTAVRRSSYPASINVSETGTDTDTIPQTTTVAEGLVIASVDPRAADPVTLLAEGIATRDTIPFLFNPATQSYSLGANSDAASIGLYAAIGTAGCVGRAVASSANVLTFESQAGGCGAARAIASRVNAMAVPH